MLVVPLCMTPGTGVCAIDDNFDKVGYTNLLPTAGEDPQEARAVGLNSEA